MVESPGQEEGPSQPEFEENKAPKKGGADTRGDEPLHTATDGSKDSSKHDQSKTRTDRSRTLTDEAGRLPDGVPGVKDEEPPGPRNEIVLDPRISYLQVSLGVVSTRRGYAQWAWHWEHFDEGKATKALAWGFGVFRLPVYGRPRSPPQYHQVEKHTGRGLEKGPILKITPDGEAELPPGQTPRPSRANTNAPDEMRRVRAERQEDGYEAGMGGTRGEGKWRGALDEHSKPRPGAAKTARFSAFRVSRASSTDHDREQQPSQSQEHESGSEEHEAAQKRWGMLRSRVLPSKQRSANGSVPTPGPGKVSALAPTAIASVPVTMELLAGQLPVMILKTWIDRDEDGHRAVPVHLGSLRFRVGDSVGVKAGRQTGKEMFKLECEYGDGAVKWVSKGQGHVSPPSLVD
jgi:phospholipase D1/2